MIRLLAASALAASLAACGGGGGATPAPTQPPSAPSVTLSASSQQLLAGGAGVALSATVSSSDAVSWQLATGAPGTLAGNGSSATYTPPASVAANTQVTVNATAGATTRSYTFTVYPAPGAPGLSLVAGSVSGRGLQDGSGAQARFGNLTAAAAHNGGALLLGDGADERRALRLLGADCSVSTLLETPRGYADGPAASARLGTILAIAPAADGSIWFIDRPSDSQFYPVYLRVMAPDKSVRTIPTGPALEAPVAMLRGLDDALYVAMHSHILRVRPDGVSTVLAGMPGIVEVGGADGTGTDALFFHIKDMALAGNGDLLVQEEKAVRRVTPAGVVTTIAKSDQLQDARSLALRTDGALVSSRPASRQGDTVIELQQVVGGTVSPWLEVATPMIASGQTYLPNNAWLRGNGSGKLLLVQSARVWTLADGTAQACAGQDYVPHAAVDGSGASARFFRPSDLAVDRAGNIFVQEDRTAYGGNMLSSRGLYVRKVTPAGQVSTVVSDDTFGSMGGMTSDSASNVYFVERGPLGALHPANGGAIWKLAADGRLSVLAGKPYREGAVREIVDGQGAAARFALPGLAGIDRSDNLYVNDLDLAGRTLYRKITPAGLVTTVDKVPEEASLAPDGRRYAAEDQAVWRLAADGSRSVIAGRPGRRGNLLGALPGGLDQPRIAPAGPGVLYVISGQALLRLAVPY